jgi:5-oxoprolinase (ATP-hydrolysing)/N-methylhydantoinase A
MISQDSGARAFRVGFDIGGTFTDFVLHNAVTGELTLHKCLTTPSDPSIGAIDGMRALLGNSGLSLRDVGEVVHGTTLVTNAIIERRGARTALVTTAGFRDVLEAGYEQRYDAHDLFLKFPDPLVPRKWRLEVAERMSRDGEVLEELDLDGVRQIAQRLKDERIEAVAICFMHAYRNPVHEVATAKLLTELCPGIAISTSADVVGELREYERACTTCANAFVQPLMERYLEILRTKLASDGFEGRLSLMLSSGGLTTPETARRLPIRLLESGPAGGGLASGLVGRATQRPDLISFDMGGTTAKATLLENYEAHIAPQMEAGRIERFKRGSGIPIKAPVIDMIEIGAGGGSIASIDDLGLLKVGPRSASAEPGPVCYGRGGTLPTVTDANLILGYLDASSFLGGEMALHRDGAERALEDLGEGLSLSAAETAWGIYQIVCENMASAARVHIVEKGHDPRRYAMVAIGGAGPAHAARVARLIGVKDVLIPQASGAASALGFLAAPPSFEVARSAILVIDAATDSQSLSCMLDDLEREARARVRESGAKDEDIRVLRTVDMRLRGQFQEISVSVPSGTVTSGVLEEISNMFRATYARLFNLHLPGEIEAINWRVRVVGATPDLTMSSQAKALGKAAVKGKRKVFFGTEYVDATVYNRYALSAGERIEGPAIIEERESTTVIPPTDTVEVDAALNIWIKLGQQEVAAQAANNAVTLQEEIRKIESDPIGLEIIWSRMVNITDQAWSNVCRTAFSLIIGVSQDFTVEILDRDGSTVASNPRGQPAFDLCMPVTVRALLERFPPDSLKPGDVLITNDPWLVAGHLDDIAIVTPVFNGEKLVGHIGAIGHVSDIGGTKRAGFAREIYEEGLRIPPMKLFRAGVRNDDLFSLVEENVRESHKVIGDIMGLVGASAVAAGSLVKLLDEYGLSDLTAFGQIVQGRSEAAMRKVIRSIPNGVHRSEMMVEIGGQPMRFPVKIEVLDEDIVIDLDGAPPQVGKGFNSSYNYTAARAVNPVKCLLTPDVRANEGCHRPIKVKVPQGSILNCDKPYPVRDRVVAGWNVTPLVLSAFANAMPERAQAFSGYPASTLFSGLDGTGSRFADYLCGGGGQGGSAVSDGKSGLIFPTSSANTSIELTESRIPIVVTEKSFVADSGGLGKHRGGLAQRIRVRKLYDDGRPVDVNVVPAGIGVQIPSMSGGTPGAAVQTRLLDADGKLLGAQSSLTLQLEDVNQTLELVLAGGHGHGDPSQRPISAVANDVTEGYVTLERARRDYGYETDLEESKVVAD